MNGTFLLISLKESRQPADRKSREHRHCDKDRRHGGIKILLRNYADAHRNETPDKDQHNRVLANGGAPFAQPQFRVGIAATLKKRSPAQGRECGEDQREIAEVKNDGVAGRA